MAKNPLVGTPLSDTGKKRDDLILTEWDERYCRTAVSVAASGDTTLEVGQVLVDKTASPSATPNLQPSFSDSICLVDIVIPDGATYEIPVLVRGPAIVNMDAIKRTSGSESDSDLKTRLADLRAQGIVFIREPAEQGSVNLNE